MIWPYIPCLRRGVSVQNEHKDIFKLFTTCIIKTYIADFIHQIVLKESIIETFIVPMIKNLWYMFLKFDFITVKVSL